MNRTERIKEFSRNHYRSGLFAFLRILLGLLIIAKTILLIHARELEYLLLESTGFNSWILVSTIILLQFTAGFLIAAGLYTRFASMAMIPVLICAMLFVGFTSVYERPIGEIVLSLVVLVGCFFFSVFDSGYYSADRALRDETEDNERFFWRNTEHGRELDRKVHH